MLLSYLGNLTESAHPAIQLVQDEKLYFFYTEAILAYSVYAYFIYLSSSAESYCEWNNVMYVISKGKEVCIKLNKKLMLFDLIYLYYFNVQIYSQYQSVIWMCGHAASQVKVSSMRLYLGL